METQEKVFAPTGENTFPLLAREINWMETHALIEANKDGAITLYSLEKLIEWKLAIHRQLSPHKSTLYSLEKLIEWKLQRLFK